MRSIIVDAGPLIALFRRRDVYHERVKEFIDQNPARLITSLPVVTEVCHFLNSTGKVAFLTWIGRGGLSVETISTDDLAALVKVIQRYRDRQIDFADASLVWVADRANTNQILTIDRTDFDILRLSDGKPFELIL